MRGIKGRMSKWNKRLRIPTKEMNDIECINEETENALN